MLGAYSCGWPLITDYGLQIGACVTDCKTKSHLATFCDQEEDSVDHILLRCVFARQVWHCCFLRASINIMLVPTTNDSIISWWMETRKKMLKENRKGFDSLIMIVCWHLWKHRNGMVFGPRREVSTVEIGRAHV